MFCTSLRKRREWAPAVVQLAGSTSAAWQGSKSADGAQVLTAVDCASETKLETHDVCFATRLRDGGDGFLRLVLLSAVDVGTPQANERIERLPLIDGKAKTAIVFLLASQEDMTAFMGLQTHMLLSRDDCIPIMPISSVAELPSCLDALRRQCDTSARRYEPVKSAQRQLLAHCTRADRPLSEGQTNVLSDISAGFAHLAQQAFDRGGQDRLCDYLGPADGQGVATFFTAGPVARPG